MNASSDDFDVDCLGTLAAGSNFELDVVTVVQRTTARADDVRVVDEDVVAVVARDESEALLIVEELHRTCGHFGSLFKIGATVDSRFSCQASDGCAIVHPDDTGVFAKESAARSEAGSRPGITDGQDTATARRPTTANGRCPVTARRTRITDAMVRPIAPASASARSGTITTYASQSAASPHAVSQVPGAIPPRASLRQAATTAGRSCRPYPNPRAMPAAVQPPRTRNGRGTMPRPTTPAASPAH